VGSNRSPVELLDSEIKRPKINPPKITSPTVKAVHDVTVAARPTTAESRALDQMNATMATAFARFSGKGTPDQWRQVMARETWFTATEAVEAGLATRVGVRP